MGRSRSKQTAARRRSDAYLEARRLVAAGAMMSRAREDVGHAMLAGFEIELLQTARTALEQWCRKAAAGLVVREAAAGKLP